MRLPRLGGSNPPYLLILKAGFFNAFLVTLFSAFTIAFLGRFEREGLSHPAGFVADVARATVLLCVITVVSCAWFGLLSGVAGGMVLYFRRRSIRSTRRLVVESAILGSLLAGIFPLIDGWMTVAMGLICMICGGICGSICAVVFRRHFRAG